MKNLLQNLKLLLLYMLPVLYIMYILYIRLILVRNPRILYVPLSTTSIIITNFIIILLMWRIYILLKKLEIIPEKPKKLKLILWLKALITKIVEKFNQIWIKFFRLFSMRSLITTRIILKLANFLNKHHEKNGFLLTVIIIFEVLPKTVVVISFLIDIFVFHKFYYFYKSLVLLLLPIIYSTTLAILEQYYEDNYYYMRECIVEKWVILKDKSITTKITYADTYEPPVFVKSVTEFVTKYFLPIAEIEETIRYFRGAQKHFKIYWVFLIILILHLIGWSTILFYGI